MFAAVITENIS